MDNNIETNNPNSGIDDNILGELDLQAELNLGLLPEEDVAQFPTIAPVVKDLRMEANTRLDKEDGFFSDNPYDANSSITQSIFDENTLKQDNRVSLQNDGFLLKDAYTEYNDGSLISRYDTYKEGVDNEQLHAISQDDKWTNGLLKFGGKTLSNVVGNVAGMAYGGIKAISQSNWEYVFDNEFMSALDDFNTYTDNSLANYKSKEERDKGFFSSMVTANFWADDFLGGLSFIAGTAISEGLMAMGSGGMSLTTTGARLGLKAGKQINRAMTLLGKTSKLGAIKKGASVGRALGETAKIARFTYTGAGFEAGMETRLYKREQEKAFYDYYRNELGRVPNSEEISNFSKELGDTANTLFLTNMALVGASNVSMFGKAVGIDPFSGTSTKIGKFLYGNGAVKTVTKDLGKGATKILSAEAKQRTGRQVAANLSKYFLAPMVMEGVVEEGGQAVASTAVGEYLTSRYRKDKEAVDMVGAVYEGFSHTFGTKEGWKEVGIGALIGLLGGKIVGVAGGNYKSELAEAKDAFSKTSEESIDKAKHINDFIKVNKNIEGFVTNTVSEGIEDKLGVFNVVKKAQESLENSRSKGDMVGVSRAMNTIMTMSVESAHSVDMVEEAIKDYEAVIDSKSTEEFSNIYGVKEDDVQGLKDKMKAQYRAVAESYEKNYSFASNLFANSSSEYLDDKDNAVSSQQVVKALAYQMTMFDRLSQDQTKLDRKFEDLLQDISPEIKSRYSNAISEMNRYKKLETVQQSRLSDMESLLKNKVKQYNRLREKQASANNIEALENRKTNREDAQISQSVSQEIESLNKDIVTAKRNIQLYKEEIGYDAESRGLQSEVDNLTTAGSKLQEQLDQIDPYTAKTEYSEAEYKTTKESYDEFVAVLNKLENVDPIKLSQLNKIVEEQGRILQEYKINKKLNDLLLDGELGFNKLSGMVSRARKANVDTSEFLKSLLAHETEKANDKVIYNTLGEAYEGKVNSEAKETQEELLDVEEVVEITSEPSYIKETNDLTEEDIVKIENEYGVNISFVSKTQSFNGYDFQYRVTPKMVAKPGVRKRQKLRLDNIKRLEDKLVQLKEKGSSESEVAKLSYDIDQLKQADIEAKKVESELIEYANADIDSATEQVRVKQKESLDIDRNYNQEKREAYVRFKDNSNQADTKALTDLQIKTIENEHGVNIELSSEVNDLGYPIYEVTLTKETEFKLNNMLSKDQKVLTHMNENLTILVEKKNNYKEEINSLLKELQKPNTSPELVSDLENTLASLNYKYDQVESKVEALKSKIKDAELASEDSNPDKVILEAREALEVLQENTRKSKVVNNPLKKRFTPIQYKGQLTMDQIDKIESDNKVILKETVTSSGDYSYEVIDKLRSEGSFSVGSKKGAVIAIKEMQKRELEAVELDNSINKARVERMQAIHDSRKQSEINYQKALSKYETDLKKLEDDYLRKDLAIIEKHSDKELKEDMQKELDTNKASFEQAKKSLVKPELFLSKEEVDNSIANIRREQQNEIARIKINHEQQKKEELEKLESDRLDAIENKVTPTKEVYSQDVIEDSRLRMEDLDNQEAVINEEYANKAAEVKAKSVEEDLQMLSKEYELKIENIRKQQLSLFGDRVDMRDKVELLSELYNKLSAAINKSKELKMFTDNSEIKEDKMPTEAEMLEYTDLYSRLDPSKVKSVISGESKPTNLDEVELNRFKELSFKLRDFRVAMGTKEGDYTVREILESIHNIERGVKLEGTKMTTSQQLGILSRAPKYTSMNNNSHELVQTPEVINYKYDNSAGQMIISHMSLENVSKNMTLTKKDDIEFGGVENGAEHYRAKDKVGNEISIFRVKSNNRLIISTVSDNGTHPEVFKTANGLKSVRLKGNNTWSYFFTNNKYAKSDFVFDTRQGVDLVNHEDIYGVEKGTKVRFAINTDAKYLESVEAMSDEEALNQLPIQIVTTDSEGNVLNCLGQFKAGSNESSEGESPSSKIRNEAFRVYTEFIKGKSLNTNILLPFETTIEKVYLGVPNLTLDDTGAPKPFRVENRHIGKEGDSNKIVGKGFIENGELLDHDAAELNIDMSMIPANENTPYVLINYKGRNIAFPVSIDSVGAKGLISKISEIINDDNLDTQHSKRNAIVRLLIDSGIDASVYNLTSPDVAIKEIQQMLENLEEVSIQRTKQEVREMELKDLAGNSEVLIDLDQSKWFVSPKVKIDLGGNLTNTDTGVNEGVKFSNKTTEDFIASYPEVTRARTEGELKQELIKISELSGVDYLSLYESNQKFKTSVKHFALNNSLVTRYYTEEEIDDLIGWAELDRGAIDSSPLSFRGQISQMMREAAEQAVNISDLEKRTKEVKDKIREMLISNSENTTVPKGTIMDSEGVYEIYTNSTDTEMFSKGFVRVFGNFYKKISTKVSRESFINSLYKRYNNTKTFNQTTTFKDGNIQASNKETGSSIELTQLLPDNMFNYVESGQKPSDFNSFKELFEGVTLLDLIQTYYNVGEKTIKPTHSVVLDNETYLKESFPSEFINHIRGKASKEMKTLFESSSFRLNKVNKISTKMDFPSDINYKRIEDLMFSDKLTKYEVKLLENLLNYSLISKSIDFGHTPKNSILADDIYSDHLDRINNGEVLRVRASVATKNGELKYDTDSDYIVKGDTIYVRKSGDVFTEIAKQDDNFRVTKLLESYTSSLHKEKQQNSENDEFEFKLSNLEGNSEIDINC